MIIIERNNKEYDAAICLNTALPASDFFQSIKYGKLIAADGAANQLFDNNIHPDLVIGDFDSINTKELSDSIGNTEFIQDHCQETNDFEKILNYCLGNNLHKLLILGIHGGELEHTLNNISVLQKFNKQLDLSIYDTGRAGILVDTDCTLITKKNEIISLIPMPFAKLTSRNLKWELIEETLEFGSKEGARNRAIADEITINIKEGTIMIFFDFIF